MIRFLSLFAVILTLAACSTNKDMSMDDPSVTTNGSYADQRDTISEGPLSDIYGEDINGKGQSDLVVDVGDRIFFATDSYQLDSEARTILDGQAGWLNQNSGSYITIEGHADERGTREYNLALGERRASAVKNYLTALGVDASRVNVVSYGKERPAVPGSNPTAWAQNRRAVTKIN